MDKDDFYSALDYSHLLIDGIVLNAKMKALFIYYPRAIEKARQYFPRYFVLFDAVVNRVAFFLFLMVHY